MDVTPSVWTAPQALLGLDPVEMPFVPRQGIGRGYKAGKEEIVGLITALRLFVQCDQAAERAAKIRRLEYIVAQLADLPHVSAAIRQPEGRPNGLPLAWLTFDEAALGQTAYQIILALKQGEPAIHPHEGGLAEGSLIIHPFNLMEGDEECIVGRVREVISG